MYADLGRLYGNEALKAALSQRVETGTAAHAYLIEGPSGSGKKTLAFLLASALSCENKTRVPCGECITCKKIFSKNSPDLYTLGFAEEDGTRKTKTIGVEAVRNLKNDVYIRPNDLERKLYIMDHAYTMTVQAQNALLKILEEPPETVVFILLCENRAALLPTVRSRVQTLTMERFSDEELLKLLLAHEEKAQALWKKDPGKLSLYVRLADGAYGRALFYLDAQQKEKNADPAYDAHEGARQCMDCLFPEEGFYRGKTALLSVIASRGDSRDRMRGLLDSLICALRDLTLCVREEEPGKLLFFEDRERARSLASLCDAKRADLVYRGLAELRAGIESNPNVQILQNMLVTVLNRLVT